MHYNEIIFSFAVQMSYAFKMEFANQIGLEMVDILLGISPISQCVLVCTFVFVCISLPLCSRIFWSVAINIHVGSKHLLNSLFDHSAASEAVVSLVLKKAVPVVISVTTL